jgi:hypothetical protein
MPVQEGGLRVGRTYCESDLSSMRDFLGQDSEEVEDTGKCRWICSESVDHVWEDILPLCHLYRQVCQTHAQLQPDGLRPGMECCEIPHYGCSQVWELCARHLVEVIHDLAVLARKTRGRVMPYLALESGGSKQFRCCVCCRRLKYRQRRRPCLLLRRPVSPVSVCHSSSASNIPTSGTARGTGVPALSVPGSPPSASCCVPPTQARSPSALRSRPCLVKWRVVVGE